MSPLPLSSVAITEKNKLTSGSVFMLLLEITIPGVVTPIRIAGNNENVTWRTYTWTAFPFELDEISDGDKGEVPRVDLRVGNVSRVMEEYIHDYDAYCKVNGYSPVTVSIYVVNSLNLASTTPEVEHIFELIQPRTNATWATFTLGADNPFSRRFPVHRILKQHCRHVFRDANCNYGGAGATCDKTVTTCRSFTDSAYHVAGVSTGNMARFGGFLGVGASGLRIA
jgi:phage-related protein